MTFVPVDISHPPVFSKLCDGKEGGGRVGQLSFTMTGHRVGREVLENNSAPWDSPTSKCGQPNHV